MKYYIFLAISIFTLQTMLIAQPDDSYHPDYRENSPLEVEIQRLPSYEKNGNRETRNENSIRDSSNPEEMERIERTLSIIKPDAVNKKHIGEIISRFENSGLRIVAIKMDRLNPDQAARFYQAHRNRPFFRDLVNFMSSGPIVVMVLEGNQAVRKNRELMGATDPQKAEKGTIRADFADSISQNAVHGSDSPQAAHEEILFFFKPNEIIPRF